MNFAHPGWLVLLVLLPLLGAGAVATARIRRRQWSEFTAPRLRSSLIRTAAGFPRWLALAFLLAACACFIIGLARPRGDAGTRTEKSFGRNVLIALDLSRSMRVRDVKPDRLSLAKMVIYEILEAMPNERIGLIGFAGDAYPYAPLTIDHRAVRETVEQIDETWAPLGGSNLASALEMAIETFRKTGQKNNALVILSDGEEHRGNLDDMIAEAERSGIYILSIGVGTEDGANVPDDHFPEGLMVEGRQVISRLRPEVMRRLAEETRGRYAVAGSGADIAGMVKTSVRDLDAFEIEGRERQVHVEFFQWAVLPGVIFVTASILASTRWRGIASTAIVLACALPAPRASADAVSAARAALEQGRHNEARDAYAALAEGARSGERRATFRLGQAAAALAAGDFKHARSAYSEALLSDDPAIRARSHAGLGNALFQIGWKVLSGAPYPADPDALPDLPAFEALVRKRFSEILTGDERDSPDIRGVSALKSLISNWTDAIRHFDSVLDLEPGSRTAIHNRELTTTYLRKLQELMREERDQTNDSILPEPQSGDGRQQPQTPPESGKGDDQNESGESADKPGDGEAPDPGEPDDGDGGDQPDNDAPPPSDDGENPESDNSGQPEDPSETPEERARRILEESADKETGPLAPGRLEYRMPEKDW